MARRVSARASANVEYRALTSETMTDNGKISGLAAPFNSQTMIGEAPWGFREKIAPGAFSKTLGEADVVYLVNHDTSMPLARTSAGTLSLRQTDRGLEFTAKPADTSYARDLAENIRSGNIQGNSFGFQVVKDDWQSGEDGIDERTIQEVKLLEVSSCTFPAYGDTDLNVRDAVNAARERRDDNKPYGDVEYADPKNGKYPIDTKAHVKAAWSYINMPKNADEYPLNGVSLASVKAKIKAAAKKFGIEISEENAVDLFAELHASLDRLEERATQAAGADEHHECIAAVDAALDEACQYFRGADRDSLPAEINQAIDLVASAAKNIGSLMTDKGIPDPDNPNGAKYDAESKPGNSTSEEAGRSLALIEAELRLRKPSSE